MADIAPFYLWPNDDRPWMDGVKAFAAWWQLSKEMGLEQGGYVFRSRRNGCDEVSVLAQERMVC